MLAHPGIEFGDERSAALPANGQALLGRHAVDLALDIEERVDAGDGLEGDRRDRRCVASAPATRGDIGKREELAASVGPAQGLDDQPGLSVWCEQPVVSGIGVGLEVSVLDL